MGKVVTLGEIMGKEEALFLFQTGKFKQALIFTKNSSFYSIFNRYTYNKTLRSKVHVSRHLLSITHPCKNPPLLF